MLDTNVSTNAVALKATQQLVFVNHTAQALTVSTTLHAAPATIEPGGFFAFKTEPGSYEFSVSGYPDGVPRRGTFDVAAAGSATIDAHAPIRYGTRTVLAGTARGPAGGKVTNRGASRRGGKLHDGRDRGTLRRAVASQRRSPDHDALPDHLRGRDDRPAAARHARPPDRPGGRDGARVGQAGCVPRRPGGLSLPARRRPAAGPSSGRPGSAGAA